MEQGTLVEWLKQTGDAVHAGDLLYVVESDKTTNEVEAMDDGVLYIPADSPPPGSVVPVGARLAFILQGDEDYANVIASQSAEAPTAPALAAPQAAVTPHNRASSLTASTPVPLSVPAATISPRARRVAQELGVAWENLRGSGKSGRIVERDIYAARSAATPEPPHPGAPLDVTPVARRIAAQLGVDLEALATATPGKRITRQDVEQMARASQKPPAPDQRNQQEAAAAESSQTHQAFSGVRRTIADRMALSARTTAPVTLMTEVDVTELVHLREQLKASAKASRSPAGAVVPSYTDIFVKLCALALQEHPALNARLEEDIIVQEQGIHIGIAVDTARGLLVAVVRDVQGKSLRQVAADSRQVIERARAGKATPNELQGSTFTITNLGMYAIDAFTPIINPPECAILGMGRIAARQVVMEDRRTVAIRDMLTLSLTFDHRIVDGAPAARFLQQVKQLAESPYLWLIS